MPYKVKAKLSLCFNQLSTMPWRHMRIGCIDPHFLDLCTNWGQVVSFMSWLLYSGTHQIEGWVGPRSGLDNNGKWKFLTLQGLELWPFVHSACSQSLYWLHSSQLIIPPCSRLKVKLHFKAACHLHLQDWRISLARNQHESRRSRALLVSCSAYSLTVKTEVTCSSEISVDFRQTTQHYIPGQNSSQPLLLELQILNTSSIVVWILITDSWIGVILWFLLRHAPRTGTLLYMLSNYVIQKFKILSCVFKISCIRWLDNKDFLNINLFKHLMWRKTSPWS
jgi:hypothetical protein